MNVRLCAGATFLAALFLPRLALAETFEVGPGKPFATIQEALPSATAGDVIEVQGDQTYPGDLWFREEQAGITVRGIPVNGKRPIIEGVGTEEWHDMIVYVNANDFVFEGFEIIGDGNPDHFGIVHKANNVTIRDVVVHGVRSQGLLGTDFESGSLTLERCEFYDNGSEEYNHQIYMATDESMYPGSVFRMQFCYVHDGAGGNNVKSRSERNEIYYNWIEGAFYHELDLIGPDGQDPGLAREDSDVVGNVLIKRSEWRIARIGGDGTGNTAGRYRFVNNTMILSASSEVAIGLQESVETLELHNNVILRVGASGGELYNHNEPSGPDPIIVGSHNWIQTGIGAVPEGFINTLSGSDAGFTDIAAWDLRPIEGSVLVDQGTNMTVMQTPAFPGALALPANVPPARELGSDGTRPANAAPDIGAFEQGSGSPPGEGANGAGGGPPGGDDGGGDGEGGADGDGNGASDSGGGCDCRAAAGPSGSGTIAWMVAVFAFLRRRRTPWQASSSS